MNRSLRQRWQLFAARIDGLGQRERVMAFCGVLASLVFVANLMVLGPLQRKQEMLRAQVAQQQDSIDGINADIVRKLEQAQADPDAPVQMRLAAVRGETERLSNELRAMQRGLVPPERIAPLLEAILRANGRLKLVSVRTLPVDPLSSLGDKKEQGASAAAAPASVKAAELLFRHGVELTVRGSYLDMVDYMTALESLPTQLFWGKAQLEVEQYPSVRLTLTLYTLSLDEKWMKL
jgi:MSHA biogenesis protein MshJ